MAGFDTQALSHGVGNPTDENIQTARQAGLECKAIALLVNRIHQAEPGEVDIWNIQAVTGGGDLDAIVKYYGSGMDFKNTRITVHSMSGSLEPLRPAPMTVGGLDGYREKGIER